MITEGRLALVVSVFSVVVAGSVAVTDYLDGREDVGFTSRGFGTLTDKGFMDPFPDLPILHLHQDLIVSNQSTRTVTLTSLSCVGERREAGQIIGGGCAIEPELPVPLVIQPGEATLVTVNVIVMPPPAIAAVLERYLEEQPDHLIDPFITYLGGRYGRDLLGRAYVPGALPVQASDPILPYDQLPFSLFINQPLTSDVRPSYDTGTWQTFGLEATTASGRRFESETYFLLLGGGGLDLSL